MAQTISKRRLLIAAALFLASIGLFAAANILAADARDRAVIFCLALSVIALITSFAAFSRRFADLLGRVLGFLADFLPW